MKNLSILLVTSFLFFLPFQVFSQMMVSDGSDAGRVEVIFHHKLKFNDLVEIKLDLSEMGISRDYRKLEFNDQGLLTAIDFHVDCNDGFSGSAATGFVTNNHGANFFRDWAADVRCPFGTGVWEKE